MTLITLRLSIVSFTPSIHITPPLLGKFIKAAFSAETNLSEVTRDDLLCRLILEI